MAKRYRRSSGASFVLISDQVYRCSGWTWFDYFIPNSFLCVSPVEVEEVVGSSGEGEGVEAEVEGGDPDRFSKGRTLRLFSSS